MKGKILVCIVLAAVLVLGLGGCKTDDDGNDFDYTPYLGTWVVTQVYYSAMSSWVPLTMVIAATETENEASPYAWLETLEFTVRSDGTFRCDGNIMDMDTEAYGRLDADTEEKIFDVIPTHGTWHNVPEYDGGDANGNKPIDSGTLAGFVGYINYVLESGGTVWKLTGDMPLFAHQWERKS